MDELFDWFFWCGLMALIVTLAVVGHAAASRGWRF
jgi:putative copper export protein